jgi:uncharacterized protein
VPGLSLAELRLPPLVFRHAARLDAAPGEVSGHYHPKLRLSAGGRTVHHRAFLADARRLILPAFGAYAGGLHADHPALARLMAPDALVVLACTGCPALPLSAAA